MNSDLSIAIDAPNVKKLQITAGTHGVLQVGVEHIELPRLAVDIAKLAMKRLVVGIIRMIDLRKSLK